MIEQITNIIENLLHDKNEKPNLGKNIIMIRGKNITPFAGEFQGSYYNINDNKLYWYVYNGFCCQEIEPSSWCYLDDVLKIINYYNI